MLQRLREEHRQIIRIMDRVETALFPAGAPEVVQIGEARWETQYILRDHFAYKDAFIYRILASSGSAKAVVTCRRLRAYEAKIRKAYHNHLARRDPSDMQANWKAYRAASLEMIRQLRHLVDLEKRDLYPLLESDAAIAQPARTPSFEMRMSATV